MAHPTTITTGHYPATTPEGDITMTTQPTNTEYEPTYSIGGIYTYSNGKNILKLGSDIRHTKPLSNGLGAQYEPGKGKPVEAILTSLKVVYAFPENWVTGLKLTSGNYNQPKRISGAKYGISDRDYDTYEITFDGPAKGKTQPSNNTEREAFPGTAFTMEATEFGRLVKKSEIPVYMGCIGSFTTTDGFTNEFNTITPTTMTW